MDKSFQLAPEKMLECNFSSLDGKLSTEALASLLSLLYHEYAYLSDLLRTQMPSPDVVEAIDASNDRAAGFYSLFAKIEDDLEIEYGEKKLESILKSFFSGE